MSFLARGFLAAALMICLSIAGFVVGASIRYGLNSSGGMEDFWFAGMIGAGIGFAVGTVAAAFVLSKGGSRRKGSRLTP